MTDWIAEALSRPPLRIADDTSAESLQSELSERLEALLASHNGLEPDADGWRSLALALALKHEPAFQIETPVDRSSLGGRPVGLGEFVLRSMLRSEVRKGQSQSQAAKNVARRVDQKASTLGNLFSRKSSIPDSIRREKYERVAEKALKSAAVSLSQE
jgi:hypothetical protein